MSAFVLVRVDTGNYDAWKERFDQDVPGARKKAKGYKIRRNVDDPDEVFIAVEFDSVEDAREAREKLLASGVLDNYPDHTGPTVAEEVEAKTYA
jgi:hypothetical protein